MQWFSVKARLFCVAVLAGCGQTVVPPLPPLPEGVAVNTPAFQSYVRNDNNFNRVRNDYTTAADATVIAGFEDSNPADPAGYRNLIALSDAAYKGNVIIEVIGKVEGTGPTETVSRLLRLTTDVTPFRNEKDGRLVAATGKYYLRGQNFVWVAIDGDPIRSGSDSDGLVNLVLDFDKQTADIDLRTGVTAQSQVRTAITANGLPFNIRTGAYGGDVTVQVSDPDSIAIFAIDGSLRGNLGGSPVYADGKHGLTTAGVYTATGDDGTTHVVVDGVFVGKDPNAP